MLKDSRPIGTIAVMRAQTGHFPQRQIELLKTFADQAVIAIENTRLFEAEQASKRELQESLEYQTAMSDVLNVISRSPNQLQPVLDAIAETAGRLCEPDYSRVHAQHSARDSVAARTVSTTLSMTKHGAGRACLHAIRLITTYAAA